MKKGAVRLKTSDEIRRIAESGRILSQVFARLETISLAGMSTWELDSLADEAITHMGARAAFKTLPGYGYASCISLNSEAAHGIPERKKIIKQGDLVKVDIGIALGGYFSDACRTFVVEPAAAEAWRLVNVCREALAAGIDMARAGNHTVDIGRAVETVAREAGFSVIRAFTGHGTGFSLDESPVVPHWDTGGTGEVLREGMVADLTVLDRDPVTAAPAEVLATKVMQTVVEGEIVFEAR